PLLALTLTLVREPWRRMADQPIDARAVHARRGLPFVSPGGGLLEPVLRAAKAIARPLFAAGSHLLCHMDGRLGVRNVSAGSRGCRTQRQPDGGDFCGLSGCAAP